MLDPLAEHLASLAGDANLPIRVNRIEDQTASSRHISRPSYGGLVLGTGALVLSVGSTCTIVRTGIGAYTVNFSISFPGTPIFIVSPEGPFSHLQILASPSQCKTQMNNAAGAAADAAFTFLATMLL